MRKSLPKTHKIKTVAAPVGGLNARDGISNMPETDAIKLVNWIPDTYGVRSRNGFSEWATNFASLPVKSVMPYFASNDAFPGGTFLTYPTTMPGEMFASTDTNIYRITSTTNAPVSAIVLSGSTNAGWFSTCMLANAAASYMLACSEADGYFTYDGAAWLRRVAGAGAGQINGVNPNNLVHVSVWKRRAFFVERDTTKVWYLAADAIAGTVAQIDFGSQFKRGGSVAYTASWTIDAGEGIDDFFVVVSSNGEVLVYKGTDPAAAATFAIVGNWSVGQVPVGRRAYCQYGGDLLIGSTDGVTPMSAVTRGGTTYLGTADKDYSGKIRPLIGGAMRQSFTNYNWQLAIHPGERLLVVNAPNHTGFINSQFVMSTPVNEWCTFNGIQITCMGVMAGYMFAGTEDGRVLMLFVAPTDNVLYDADPLTGTAIAGEIVPAYSYFDAPALNKEFLMCRASFLGRQAPSALLGMNIDFQIPRSLSRPAYVVKDQSLWDIGTWDSAVWSGGQEAYAEWVGIEGVGYAGALTLSTVGLGGTIFTSCDFMYKIGGPF